MTSMKTPIFVGPLSEEERESLEKGLRSKDTFTMGRSQMLLASSRGERAPKIALNLGCASQTRCARPSTTSTRGASPRSIGSPRAPRRPARPSTKRAPRLCARCSTARRGSSGTSRACGLLRWPQRGRLRGGTHRRAGLGGDRPGYAFAPSWGEVDAGQAVDHLPRPSVRKKKRLAKLATG